MGKTTVGRMLTSMGLPVDDADKTVHNLLEPGGRACADVIKAFPQAFDKKLGRINRKKLGDIVFNDSNKKRELENIIHPLVRKSQQEFIKHARHAGHGMAVLDVPLLFEYGAYRQCDYTICVSAPFFVQKMRVLSRPGMNEEKFYRRLKNQYSDYEKRQMADFIVNTGLSKANTMAQVKDIILKIEKDNGIATVVSL